jgi:predicted  nucleic acid-binding Zn-ribbon protein
MSRRHAEVRLDAATGQFTMHDNRSANGTFVNGQGADGTPLHDGDEILLAEFKVEFVGHAQKAAASSARVEIPPASATLAGGRVAVTAAEPSAPDSIAEDIDILEMDDLVEDEPVGSLPPSAMLGQTHEATSDVHEAHTPFALGTDEAAASDSSPPQGFSTPPQDAMSGSPAGGSSAALELARRERDRYQDRVRALTGEVTSLRAELDAAPSRDELDTAVGRSEALETEIEHLNERVRAVGTRLREADAALDDRQAQLDELRAALDEARTAASDAVDQTTDLRHALDTVTVERDALRAELDARDALTKEASARIEAAEGRAAVAEAGLAEVSELQQVAQARIGDLERELRDARSEVEDLAGQLNEAADPEVIDMQARRIVDLATALDNARADRDASRAECESAESARDMAIASARELAANVALLGQQLEERQGALDTITSTLADRERELETERVSSAAATASNEALRAELETLQTSAAADAEALASARTNIGQLDARVSALTSALSTSRAMNDRIGGVVSALTDAMAAAQQASAELSAITSDASMESADEVADSLGDSSVVEALQAPTHTEAPT